MNKALSFYRSAHFVCRIGCRALPEREGDPGVRAGMETDAKVALTPHGRRSLPLGLQGLSILLVTPVTVRNVTSRQFAGLLLT